LPVQRLRVTFSKGEPVRWIGHLDVARFWTRALRRADIPLVYSQSFNPQPKIHFASALPVGVSGRMELMDIWVSPPQDPDEVQERLQAQCPNGFQVHAVRTVPLHWPALQSQVRQATYRIQVERAFLPSGWRSQLEGFLLTKELWLERRRKKTKVRYNLRPLVLDLRLEAEGAEWVTLFARMRSEPGATGRPDELLRALGWEDVPRRIERLQIVLDAEKPASG